MSTNSNPAPQRYRGQFNLADVSGHVAPVYQPAQPQPAPASPAYPQPAPVAPVAQPAPASDPYRDQPAPTPKGGQGLGGKVIIGVLAVVVIAVVIWAVKFALGPKTDVGDAADGTPVSETGDTAGAGDDAATGSPEAEIDRVAEAALLDSWFSDVTEENWVEKTPEELGATATTPLGQFCRDSCIVLSDGAVVTRAMNEDGEKVSVVVSGYTVPGEWHGKAVLLDNQQIDLALVVMTVPDDDAGDISGSIWQWQAEGGYSYLNSGHSSRG